MSGKEIFEVIDKPISCFSFNKDRTQVALSPNDHNVIIFKKSGNKWVKDATLTEHHQTVTGIDWAANSNRIVTCGADRNAYVWVIEDGKWKPTLVLLRINRAATCVRWSPQEDKFAVGSSARLISICYYEKENKWWVSKHVKKPIRSTILSLAWHPNNVLLAAGSSDFKVRVFSAYIKEIESKPESTSWGKKMPFGNLMGEWSNGRGGWVHCVAFSPSGGKVAWVGHDSSVSIIQSGENAVPAVLPLNNLPFVTCLFVSEGSIVAAGHDYVPMVFSHDDNNVLTFMAKLDQPSKKNDDEEETMSAMQRFRSLDKRATVGSKAGKSLTTHVNMIKQMSIYTSDGATVSQITSGGMDGKIVIWSLKTLEKAIEDLKL
jgi:actin related protein 2/3 complex subunit 1A/1B